MSCSENFKGMLALAYSQQSLNMSKHSEKHKFRRLYGNSKQSRQRRNTLLTHNGGRGPELSEEGREETKPWRSLMWWCAPSKLLRVNLCVQSCFPSTQTCKYQNLEKKPKRNPKNLMWNVNASPSAHKLAHPHANTLTQGWNGLLQTRLPFQPNKLKPTSGETQFRLFAFMMMGFLLTYVAQ